MNGGWRNECVRTTRRCTSYEPGDKGPELKVDLQMR